MRRLALAAFAMALLSVGCVGSWRTSPAPAPVRRARVTPKPAVHPVESALQTRARTLESELLQAAAGAQRERLREEHLVATLALSMWTASRVGGVAPEGSEAEWRARAKRRLAALRAQRRLAQEMRRRERERAKRERARDHGRRWGWRDADRRRPRTEAKPKPKKPAPLHEEPREDDGDEPGKPDAPAAARVAHRGPPRGLMRAIRSRSGALAGCLPPGAEPARVRFQARLDPRGALRDVVANMPESPRVAACLAERLGAVRLPRYRGDSRLVRFSLALRGDER